MSMGQWGCGRGRGCGWGGWVGGCAMLGLRCSFNSNQAWRCVPDTPKVLHGRMGRTPHRRRKSIHHDGAVTPPCANPFPSSGVACGAAASGHYVWNDPTDVAQLLTCMMMSGPFLTGYTQTINDW